MEVDTLSLAAVGSVLLLAVLHTAIGPDHYLPFVMLGRARRWSLRKTLVVTAACGVGHVASSLALGAFGLGAGAAVGAIEGVETQRGPIAAWALVALGVVYGLWGLRQGLRHKRGIELHSHDGHVHLHSHGDHAHGHGGEPARRETTFWALFIVFVLGPCEPLIPLFVLPASQGRWGLAAVMAVAFCVATLVTMLLIVAAGLRGAQRVRLGGMERWSHALAGAVLAASGAAVLLAPI
jgi:hypothetical protein